MRPLSCDPVGAESLFNPSEPRQFAGIGRYYPGWSDRPSGVQWSLWHDLHRDVVVLAVNLEGMADAGDWPVGRVIERERSDPLLPALAAASTNRSIEAWIGRDVWNPGGRGKIRTDDFLYCSLGAVTRDGWMLALEEARSSQNATHSGRGTLEVLLKKGTRRVCEVSPHIDFALPVWGASLPSYLERPDLLAAARRELEPLYDFLSKRAAP